MSSAPATTSAAGAAEETMTDEEMRAGVKELVGSLGATDHEGELATDSTLVDALERSLSVLTPFSLPFQLNVIVLNEHDLPFAACTSSSLRALRSNGPHRTRLRLGLARIRRAYTALWLKRCSSSSTSINEREARMQRALRRIGDDIVGRVLAQVPTGPYQPQRQGQPRSWRRSHRHARTLMGAKIRLGTRLSCSMRAYG